MLFPFFQWCQDSSLGVTIRESVWMFPIIEAVHLLGLALIGGAVLIVDLRLAGLVLQRQPASTVASDAEPWLIGSLTMMLVTGVLLFTSEALKCYYSPPFWLKMLFLALAITFTFTLRRRVAAAADARMSPWLSRTVAIVSVLLWSGVGLMGRGIGFY
jgi:uncharacterized membrane protein SirB2